MPLLGGVRPPIAVLLTLLVAVSCLALFTVGNSDDRAVSRAIVDSQGDIAADSARSLGTSIEANSAGLRDAVALLGRGRRKPLLDQLDSLASAYGKWRGIAVLDAVSGRELTSFGEPVPLKGAPRGDIDEDALRPRLAADGNGAALVVSYALFEGADGKKQLVVSTGALRLPNQSGGSNTYVVDARGRIVAASGPKAYDEELWAAVQDRDVDVRREGRQYYVVGRAEVPDSEHVKDLKLTMATVAAVPVGTAVADDRFTGLAAAGTLLAVGLLVTLLLVRYIQRPLLGLHQEAQRIARGDLGDPVAVRAARGEARRIANALESLRQQLLDRSAGFAPRTQQRRQRIGLRVIVLGCAALIAAWAVALPFAASARDDDQVPQQIGLDQQYRTQSAADRVHGTLAQTVADLSTIAQLADNNKGGVAKVLDDQLPGHDNWGSLYLVDREGKILARAGKTPLDTDRKAALAQVKTNTPGVVQLNHSGKVPVVAAAVTVGDGSRQLLVSELTPDAFNGVLTRSRLGRTWLVDAGGRIIASNQGFIAFSSPPRPNGDILAAALVKGVAATNDRLGWRVVTHKPTSWLRLAGYESERSAELSALLAVAAAVLGLGWLELTVLRPLRAAGRSAGALASGERTAVIYPVHQDEVGSVARSLELLRQQLADPRRETDHSTAHQGADDTLLLEIDREATS
ncbi:HAMP domain-containing protein [Streptomyces graminilatus]|uniref:HAMP domain-containing protein n=1 Tax=Streptomyces graminilatus TaxID=1464070 RepID=UPI0006E2BC4B|nr:HAMP domain-containing protein [Streptomyces graminilatus]